jgi:hypothetical protein
MVKQKNCWFQSSQRTKRLDGPIQSLKFLLFLSNLSRLIKYASRPNVCLSFRTKMIQAELLEWLGATIENDDGVSLDDLKNGLPLLQLLSLISPATVNLTWNTTLEAQECPNISLRNYGIILDNSSFARKRFKASQAKSSPKYKPSRNRKS